MGGPPERRDLVGGPEGRLAVLLVGPALLAARVLQLAGGIQSARLVLAYASLAPAARQWMDGHPSSYVHTHCVCARRATPVRTFIYGAFDKKEP